MTRCTANTKCSSERPATQYNLPHLMFLNTSKESNCVIGTVSFTNNAYHNRVLIAHMHMPNFFLLSCCRCACCRTSVSIYTHIISTSSHTSSPVVNRLYDSSEIWYLSSALERFLYRLTCVVIL